VDAKITQVMSLVRARCEPERESATMLTDECLAKWTASYGCRHLRGDAVGDGEKRLVLDSWAETPERANAPQRSKALRPRRPLRPWRGILEALACAIASTRGTNT
jgi:hypothetical protein